MRGRIITVIVLLICGVIVNIAVAWACAIWSPQDRAFERVALDVPTEWPTYLQQLDWPVPDTATERDVRGIGVTVIEIVGGDREASWLESGPGSEKTRAMLVMRRFGFPGRALQWESHKVRAGPRSVDMTIAALEAAGLRAGVYVSGEPRRDGSFSSRDIPLVPVVPGFIINTLFYAALLWLIFIAPFTARRMLRRRRGLCEKCTYPIGVSPVCTECGAPVRARAADS